MFKTFDFANYRTKRTALLLTIWSIWLQPPQREWRPDSTKTRIVDKPLRKRPHLLALLGPPHQELWVESPSPWKPWKLTAVEPKNHPIENESLGNLHYIFGVVNFPWFRGIHGTLVNALNAQEVLSRHPQKKLLPVSHIYAMGRIVYLPTWMGDFKWKLVGTSTSHGSVMGPYVTGESLRPNVGKSTPDPFCMVIFSSWWLNQPIWKICPRQIGSWNPRDRGENKKSLKPPPSFCWASKNKNMERNIDLHPQFSPLYLEDHPMTWIRG